MKKVLAIVLALTLVLALGASAFAADYPSKQITVICPYAAGGASDTICRIFAAGLETELGVPVVVQDVTGAAGSIGFETGANADPDGYTVTYLSAEITINKLMGYTDMTPENYEFLGRNMVLPPVIAVAANSEFETLQDLLDAAAATPNAITMGLSSLGSFYHIGALKLQTAAGVSYTYVPFSDGTATAVAAVMGGSVKSVVAGTSEIKSYADSGDVRVLAVLADERSASFPDVPTAKELGYDAVSATWGVFAVPLGTPDDVLEVLRDAAKKVIEGDDMVEVLNSRGFENAYLPGPEMKELAIQILADNEEVLTSFGLIDAD